MTRAVRVSVAFLLGGAVATTVGVAITRGIFALLANAVSPGTCPTRRQRAPSSRSCWSACS
ncbi:hypothetical protein FCI23_55220 [Actinacidiphila oryziradicis]|uniref:Uncharacterized protein n=1 Tax=Actinacidiphila oryziradicis TaxID=2571141 RepID=A0A4U0RAG9_9ACTN|nr:hypothetical protein FCI23_55220 [Actinacidiphila oryziradicis]